jgi:hypothetical protein
MLSKARGNQRASKKAGIFPKVLLAFDRIPGGRQFGTISFGVYKDQSGREAGFTSFPFLRTPSAFTFPQSLVNNTKSLPGTVTLFETSTISNS